MQYMQGMAHAEFPDYVSDAARNLILRLCRWTIKILISTHLYRTVVLPYGIGDSQRYH